jgi:hypothetical protein
MWDTIWTDTPRYAWYETDEIKDRVLKAMARLTIPTSEYDNYYKNADEYIASRPTGEAPFVPTNYLELATEQFRDRIELNRDTKNIPLKRLLPGLNEMIGSDKSDKIKFLSELTGISPKLVHLHGAIFHESEKVDEQIIISPSYWWDEDVIQKEFGHEPKPNSPVDYKVDWYLNQISPPPE